MHLPGPFRAAVGLAATAAEELKNLPDRAVELPMLAVSTALQLSLRAQQRYARLAARGEQVLNRQEPSEQPPAWATFDEPVSVDELRQAALAQLDSLVDGDDDGTGDGTGSRNPMADLFGDGAAGNGRAAGRMFEELFGVSDPAGGAGSGTDGADNLDDGGAATVTPITQAPGAAAKTGAAPRKSARKTSRKTATRKTATKSAPVSTAAKKAAPVKKTPRKAAPKAAQPERPAATEQPEQPEQPGKTVNKPRHTAPSKFDDADDS